MPNQSFKQGDKVWTRKEGGYYEGVFLGSWFWNDAGDYWALVILENGVPLMWKLSHLRHMREQITLAPSRA